MVEHANKDERRQLDTELSTPPAILLARAEAKRQAALRVAGRSRTPRGGGVDKSVLDVMRISATMKRN